MSTLRLPVIWPLRRSPFVRGLAGLFLAILADRQVWGAVTETEAASERPAGAVLCPDATSSSCAPTSTTTSSCPSASSLAVAPFFTPEEAQRAQTAHFRSLQVAKSYKQPTSKQWSPRSVEDLHKNYRKIFKHGNRNAASHLWSTFILDRAFHLTDDQLQLMFGGFCAVSGSPASPSDYNRYGLTLPLVPSLSEQPQWPANSTAFGFFHYCCWPCVCDTQDFIRVDTKTITISTSGGEHEQRQYYFAVLGNPCPRSSQFDVPFKDPFDRGIYTIRQVAAEVRCDEEDQLIGATLSDNGYVIVGMVFEAEVLPADPADTDGQVSARSQSPLPQPGRLSKHPKTGRMFHHEREFAGRCEDRKNAGYNSGMGEIFRKVAGISPIVVDSADRAMVDGASSRECTQEAGRAVGTSAHAEL